MACSLANPAECFSSVAKAAAGDAFASIAHDFARSAASAVNWLWGQIGAATVVHLGGRGFDLDAGIVVAITAVVAVGLFAIQVTASALRRDASGLARALRGLVVAFIGGGVAVAVTGAALAAVDSLSAGVVQVATGGTIAQLGHSVLSGNAVADATTNPAGLMLLSLAALVAVVVVWAALAVRKVLIVISAVFAPLAFAGSLADITVSWTRRWIEVTAALIAAKLLLVIIFVVGLGMLVGGTGLAGTGATQTVTQEVAGILVLAMAGFAPWMALRVVHFSGDHFGHLHALAGATTGGARAAVTAPQKVAAWKSGAAGLAAGSSASSSRASGAGNARDAATRQEGKAPPPGSAGPDGATGPGRGSPAGSGGASPSTAAPPESPGPAPDRHPGADGGRVPAPPAPRPGPDPSPASPRRPSPAPAPVGSSSTPTPRSR